MSCSLSQEQHSKIMNPSDLLNQFTRVKSIHLVLSLECAGRYSMQVAKRHNEAKQESNAYCPQRKMDQLGTTCLFVAHVGASTLLVKPSRGKGNGPPLCEQKILWDFLSSCLSLKQSRGEGGGSILSSTTESCKSNLQDLQTAVFFDACIHPAILAIDFADLPLREPSSEATEGNLSCPKDPELKGDHLLALLKMGQNGKTKR